MARSEDTWGNDERGLERLTGLSDGIFAIAITLLVLDLKLPELGDNPTDQELLQKLLDQSYSLLGFVISFAVLGFLWLNHHRTLFYLRRYDQRFVALNLLYLFFVAILPYPTSVVGHYGPVRTAVVFYAGTLLAAGIARLLLWWYATRGHRLVSPTLDPAFIRSVSMRILASSLVFAVSIAVAFLSPAAAMFLWFFVGPAGALVPIRGGTSAAGAPE